MTQGRLRVLFGAATFAVVASLVTVVTAPPVAAEDPAGAGLAVALDAVHDPVAAGGSIEYRAYVDNLGPDAAQDAEVTIDLDPATTFVGTRVEGTHWDGPSPCTASGSVVTCPLGELVPDEQVVITVEVTAGGVGTRRASAAVTATNAIAPPEGWVVTDDETTEVVEPAVDLHLYDVSPYLGQDPVVDGPAVVQLSVVNAGPADALDVDVVVEVPSDLVISSATVDGSPCATASGSVTCHLDVLAAWAAAEVIVTLVGPSAPGTIAYSATVRGGTFPELDPEDNEVAGSLAVRAADLPPDGPPEEPPPAEGTVTLVPRLQLPVHSYEGDLVDIVVVVHVSGPNPARGTTFRLFLPQGLTFELASTSCTPGGASSPVECPLGDLAPGQRVHHVYARAGAPVHAATVTLEVGTASPVVFPVGDTVSRFHTISEVGAPLPLDFAVGFEPSRPIMLTGTTFHQGLFLDLFDSSSATIPSGPFDPVVHVDVPSGLVVERAEMEHDGDRPCAVVAVADTTRVTCTFTGTLPKVSAAHLALRAEQPGSYQLRASFGGSTRLDPNPANDEAVTDVPIVVVDGPGAVRHLPGCRTSELVRTFAPNSAAVTLPFPLVFDGAAHGSAFVNQTGSVTFDAPVERGWVPTLEEVAGPFFAPFLGELLLQEGEITTASSIRPGRVFHGTTSVDGHPAYCVIWDDVPMGQVGGAGVGNTFQLLLIDRGQGDFDVELAYDQLATDRANVHLPSALAGFRLAADQVALLPSSGVPGALLDADLEHGLVHGTRQALGQLGRYRFSVRGGIIQPADHPVDRPPTLDVPDTITLPEGDAVDLTPVADDPDGDPVQVYVVGDLPAGAYWNGAILTWPTTEWDVGTYTVTFQAVAGSLSVERTVTIVVTETSTADAGIDQTGQEGDAIGVAGSVEHHPGTTTWSYQPVGEVDPGTTCTFADPHALTTTLTCNDDGTFLVTLSLDRTAVTDTALYTVTNVAPAARIYVPAPDAHGRAQPTGPFVELEAVGFPEPSTNDLPDVTCTIDWGDGTVVPGVATPGTPETGTERGVTCTSSHTYVGGGERTVVVTFSDGDETGLPASVVVPVPFPPTITLERDVHGREGVALTIAGSAGDPDGDLAADVVATFGDGTPPVTVHPGPDGAFTLTHTYGDDGTYVVEACASDGGGRSTCDQVTVTVVDVAPTAPSAPTPSVPSPNQGTFELTWSPSTDVAADVVAYRVERRPSGATGPWAAVTAGITAPSLHLSDHPEGSWTFRVVAIAGGAATEGPGSAAVVVDRTVPVASIACPASVPVGATASAGWTASDDRAGLATPASGSVALVTTTAGNRTAVAPAPVDLAGNVGAAASCSYTVVAAAPTPTRLAAGPVLLHVVPGLEITLRLSATLTTATGAPVSGRLVTFRVGSSVLCTATTDAKGVATCSGRQGVLVALLAVGYTATFAGDTAHAGSTARGALVTIG